MKREGWVVVYHGKLSTYLRDQRIHPTKAEADRAIAHEKDCAPVRIEWDEPERVGMAAWA